MAIISICHEKIMGLYADGNIPLLNKISSIPAAIISNEHTSPRAAGRFLMFFITICANDKMKNGYTANVAKFWLVYQQVCAKNKQNADQNGNTGL
jgi:hypothetical protein